MHVACGPSYALYGTMAGLSVLGASQNDACDALALRACLRLGDAASTGVQYEDAQASFRKVARKVRPDKGCSAADTSVERSEGYTAGSLQLQPLLPRHWRQFVPRSRHKPSLAHGGAFLPNVSMSSD